MIITITGGIKRAVNLCKKIAAGKNFPVLQDNFLLEARDGQVFLTSKNFESTVRAGFVECTATENGTITIPREIAEALTVTEYAHIARKDGRVVASSHASFSKEYDDESEDYPLPVAYHADFLVNKKSTGWLLDTPQDLSKRIARALDYTVKETHSRVKGLHIVNKDGAFTIEAADGARAYISCINDVVCKPDFDVVPIWDKKLFVPELKKQRVNINVISDEETGRHMFVGFMFEKDYFEYWTSAHTNGEGPNYPSIKGIMRETDDKIIHLDFESKTGGIKGFRKSLKELAPIDGPHYKKFRLSTQGGFLHITGFGNMSINVIGKDGKGEIRPANFQAKFIQDLFSLDIESIHISDGKTMLTATTRDGESIMIMAINDEAVDAEVVDGKQEV